MCRIFGFRSILQSGVHRSLMDSENAIIQQSDRHPDGWGVAYYNMGSPHLVRNDNQAAQCKIFEKVSGVVSSQTVVAHIRKSTVGSVGPLNTHPFQFGPWVFAHNGNIESFDLKKSKLIQKIDPELKRYILGDTDSEHLFYLLLTVLKKRACLREGWLSGQVSSILQDFANEVVEVTGPMVDSKGDYDKNYLTFVLTNGQSMVALQGGQQLFYSTHKTQCPERDSCAFYSGSCEKVSTSGEKIHHLLVSSEVIKNENQWSPLDFGHFVSIDHAFRFEKGFLKL